MQSAGVAAALARGLRPAAAGERRSGISLRTTGEAILHRSRSVVPTARDLRSGARRASARPAVSDTLGVMRDDEQERGVLVAERALQAAMLAGDVDQLDRLLHPDLLAVGPDGQLVGKAEDLSAHASGVFTISELIEEDVRVLVIGETAVTFVLLAVRGAIAEEEVAGRMRYTRTWSRDGGAWRVMAAHISPVA